MLEHAAYLHDIGSFISFRGHQVHSHYIITNADLLGFDQGETAVLALIARYHRKKVPGKKEGQLESLSAQTRRTVRILSTLLRYAEHLDRTHAGHVQHARFVPHGDDEICLAIECPDDCSLEVWAARSDADAFAKVFGKRLTIESVPPGQK